MSEKFLFESLTLEGFRAYLSSKTFYFGDRRCLAIFAPNGKGKSSIVDAFEFLFSEEGTLKRLGQRALNNLAGPQALAHNKAEAEGIAPTVKFAITNGTESRVGERPASGVKRSMPEAAATMKAQFATDPIIRGYSLRSFVEDHSAEQRYAEVAGWLQLSTFVETQKNLRLLRRDLRAKADDEREIKQHSSHLSAETNNEVESWDENAVLLFVHEHLIAPLSSHLKFEALDEADPTYAEVSNRAKIEAEQVGLAGLRQIRNTASALWLKEYQTEDAEAADKGAIAAFEAAISALLLAQEAEEKERNIASDTVFNAVWNAASELFEDDSTAPEECPVCTTPLKETAAGSVHAIRGLLGDRLSSLRAYGAARRNLEETLAEANDARRRLLSRIEIFLSFLDADGEDGIKPILDAYRSGVDNYTGGLAPRSSDIKSALEAIVADFDHQILALERAQGDHTWAKVKAKIDALITLKNKTYLAHQRLSELHRLFAEFENQSKIVSERIRLKVQSLLDILHTPMNAIYKAIQGDDAPRIRLQLPGEEDKIQQRLQLVIDFAENRVGVPPGGYLSDSQLHSVALALRLAAIKQFNAAAPVIVLDDIVTSYDADHRRAIGSLLASDFPDWQIILATHDERFFNHLKDQLSAAEWKFTRIIGYEPDFGPKFADHRITDQMIEARWAVGEPAANEMRQAEEEWLLQIAREFGINIRIRTLERAYSYERAELALALGNFLKEANLTPPDVPGINNRFINSLVRGDIENFGSHFQEGPYGDGSIGDEKTRWNEFRGFRAQFACPECNRTKFQRPYQLKKPVCAHRACETQFSFSNAKMQIAGSSDTSSSVASLTQSNDAP